MANPRFIKIFALLAILSIAELLTCLELDGDGDLIYIPLNRFSRYSSNQVSISEGLFALPDARIHSYKSRDQPLGGGESTLGEYYVEMVVAGQTFRAIVDTGSSILYIPSTTCTLSDGPNAGQACTTFDPPLNVSTAPVRPTPCSTFGCTCSTTNGVCTQSSLFGDGSSVSGPAYNSSVSVGSITAPNAAFVAFDSTSSGFTSDPGTSVDGLWGMGYQIYPDNVIVTIPTVLDAMFQETGLPHVFSLDLHPTGGTLLIGGFNQSKVVQPIQWTPIINTGWYVINNPQLAVGKSTTTLEQFSNQDPTATTIVDSGSTLLGLTPSYWAALQNGMKTVSGCPPYMCTGQTIFDSSRPCFTDFPFDSYPVIAFLLPAVNTSSAVQLILQPREYMVQTVDVNGTSCVAFGLYQSTNGFFIFGDTFMVNYYTIFDRGNSQIGFSYHDKGVVLSPVSPVAPSGNAPFADAAAVKGNLLLALIIAVLVILTLYLWS